MAAMRRHIVADTFAAYRDEQRRRLTRGDDEHPSIAADRRRRRRNEDGPRPLRHSRLRRMATRASCTGVGRDDARRPRSGGRGEARSTSSSRACSSALREPTSDAARGVGRGAGRRPQRDGGRSARSESGGRASAQRPVRLISFEHDVASLRLALRNAASSRTCTPPAPGHVLRFGEWRSARVPLVWTLLEGDFRSHLADAPDARLHLLRSVLRRDRRRRCGRSTASRALFAELRATTTPSSSPTPRPPRCARRCWARFIVARGAPTGTEGRDDARDDARRPHSTPARGDAMCSMPTGSSAGGGATPSSRATCPRAVRPRLPSGSWGWRSSGVPRTLSRELAGRDLPPHPGALRGDGRGVPGRDARP